MRSSGGKALRRIGAKSPSAAVTKVCWSLSALLLLALLSNPFLCAVPKFFYLIAALALVPVVIGNRLLRVVGILLLIGALARGYREACTFRTAVSNLQAEGSGSGQERGE